MCSHEHEQYIEDLLVYNAIFLKLGLEPFGNLSQEELLAHAEEELENYTTTTTTAAPATTTSRNAAHQATSKCMAAMFGLLFYTAKMAGARSRR